MGKNYTIYIKYPEFQSELNKSGLLNDLYRQHLDQVYQKVKDFHTVGIDSTVEFETKEDGFKTTVRPNKKDVKRFKNKIAKIIEEPTCKHGMPEMTCKFAKNGRKCK